MPAKPQFFWVSARVIFALNSPTLVSILVSSILVALLERITDILQVDNAAVLLLDAAGNQVPTAHSSRCARMERHHDTWRACYSVALPVDASSTLILHREGARKRWSDVDLLPVRSAAR
jgi:hypothetical protein